MLGLFKTKKEDKPSLISKLKSGLAKTRNRITENAGIFRKHTLDSETIDSIETSLLSSDVGIALTEKIVHEITLKSKQTPDMDVYDLLKEELVNILNPVQKKLDLTSHKPFIILMVGINGAGKTTTLGKIASILQRQEKTCLIAAGDTFRAAAIEQLTIWGERNGIDVISQSQGSDSASVIHDGITSAKAKNTDIILADTAGRLHTQDNLMQELTKIVKVIKKVDSTGPHETLLVLDGTIGQNAIVQAKKFHEAIGITGLVITKLDGTAKGGAVINIAKEMGLPIRYIGVGEGIDDLLEFQAVDFVEALLND